MHPGALNECPSAVDRFHGVASRQGVEHRKCLVVAFLAPQSAGQQHATGSRISTVRRALVHRLETVDRICRCPVPDRSSKLPPPVRVSGHARQGPGCLRVLRSVLGVSGTGPVPSAPQPPPASIELSLCTYADGAMSLGAISAYLQWRTDGTLSIPNVTEDPSNDGAIFNSAAAANSAAMFDSSMM